MFFSPKNLNQMILDSDTYLKTGNVKLDILSYVQMAL